MNWKLPLIAALALSAAAPPGWFPGAGPFVALGLAAFYAVACGAPRPYLAAYALGVAHVLAFSWSLHNAFWVGYVLIAVLGGGYYALTVLWYRALARWLPGPVAFSLAAAGAVWLRAAMPGIPYPHAQPIHSLYRTPALMQMVAWGGEVFANALLAGLAAAVVDLWQAWRLAAVPWRAARRVLLAFGGTAAVSTLVPPPPAHPPTETASKLRVVAIEPNLSPRFFDDPAAVDLLRERLCRPTMELAPRGAKAAPALVLWPETSWPVEVDATIDPPRLVESWPLPFAADTTLVFGTRGRFRGDRLTPCAVAIDPRGRVTGLHEKRWLVPGGEVLPGLDWLPESTQLALLDRLTSALGVRPLYRPGEPRPPMRTASGVAFGVLLCYDNCFAEISDRLVATGAQVLAVLSNEAWYGRGNELPQMEAMTVCRALETGTPVVRCTMDGATMAVDAAGRLLGRLDYGSAPAEHSRSLDLAVPLGPGVLPPLAWLRPWVPVGVALSGLAIAWHLALRWARLLRGGAQARDGAP